MFDVSEYTEIDACLDRNAALACNDQCDCYDAAYDIAHACYSSNIICVSYLLTSDEWNGYNPFNDSANMSMTEITIPSTSWNNTFYWHVIVVAQFDGLEVVLDPWSYDNGMCYTFSEYLNIFEKLNGYHVMWQEWDTTSDELI